MTNREKLQESYEDSVLALLMDEFAESEGERYMEENERLMQDADAAMPEEMARRALHLIDRELSKRSRRHTGRKLLSLLARFAVAALVALLLFGTAFALSETVRAGTLNLLMKIDSQIATWQFVPDEGAGIENSDGSLDVTVGWIPDGYTLPIPMVLTPSDIVLNCTNDVGDTIIVSVHASGDFTYTIDLENADYSTRITVQDCDGILVVKNGTYGIYWPYNNTELAVSVESSSADESTLLRVAESVSILR